MICCARCHAENDDSRRYCGAFGVGLIRWCTGCSFKNRVTDAYCGGCGAQLGEGPAAQPLDRPTAKAPAVEAAPPPLKTTTPAGLLSLVDIRALMAPKPAPAAPTKPATGKVSQSELDALFGEP